MTITLEPILPALLDTAAAAAYLGIEAQTLCVWRCNRRYKLPFIRVGRLIKYRRRDLDAWLDRRTVGAAAGADR